MKTMVSPSLLSANFIDLKSDVGSAGSGEPPVKADVVMSMDSADFIKMFTGEAEKNVV